MLRRIALLLAVLLGVVPLISAGLDAQTARAADCGFSLGFKTLHDMIPDIVGDCRENEWHNAFNGDGLQQTTGGLLVWRKADNWTAFTNGSITWINGPAGLAARQNDERFPWEGVADVPAPTDPGGSVPSTESSQGLDQSASTTSAPAPSVIIRISDTRPNNQEEFTVRLEASSDIGLDSMWWWATSTDDDDLRDTHSVSCRSVNPCRRSWDVRTKDWGRIIIHAKVRDTSGQESDEVARDVRVREPAPTATPTDQPTATPLSTATTAMVDASPSGSCGVVQTLALNPMVGTATVGTPHSIVVMPSDGVGCSGTVAMLRVQSGPNEGSPAVSAPIGLDGTATLTYTGATVGVDTVLVWLDLTPDSVQGPPEPNALGMVTWSNGATQP